MRQARIHDRHAPPASGGLPAPHVLRVEAVCVAAAILAQFGPAPVRILSALLLIAWALVSAHGIVQSLSISVLAIQANTGLSAETPAISALRWLLILACLGRIVLSRGRPARNQPAWFPSFGLFLGVAAILLLLAGYDRTLSALKLMSFAVGALVALLGLANDTRPPGYWLDWFFTVHTAVVLTSVPLLFLPVGYWRTGWSFQGVFSHPQSFGVYLAFWGSYLVVYLLTSRRVSLFVLCMTGLTAYFIFVAHCRTAVLATAASIVVTGLTVVLGRRDGMSRPKPWTVARFCAIVLLIVGAFVYDSSRASAVVIDFAAKKFSGSGDDVMGLLAGSFQGSRGEQVQRLLNSISARPLTGVGFGLAPMGVTQEVQRDGVWGLPVSAPTEQGFLPLGVLAQVGVFGASILLFFLCKLAAPVVRFAPAPVLALFSTALLLNLGEMIFFATGDLGLQMWLILGLCHQYIVYTDRSVGYRASQLPCRGVQVGARRREISYAR
jgi:hypothetical protein